MTDQERANRFVAGPLTTELATDARTDDLRRELAEEFSATRLYERRAIVAWLRTWDGSEGLVGLIQRLATRIERGEASS